MSHTCGQSVKCNKLNRTAPRGLLPNRPLLVKANVEILYFESCPIWQETQAPVERVASDLPIELDLRLVELADANATVEHRFLGSPSVRANGSDVEPGAATRARSTPRLDMGRSEGDLIRCRPDADVAGLPIARQRACGLVFHPESNGLALL
jgi:hypothetical protein